MQELEGTRLRFLNHTFPQYDDILSRYRFHLLRICKCLLTHCNPGYLNTVYQFFIMHVHTHTVLFKIPFILMLELFIMHYQQKL